MFLRISMNIKNVNVNIKIQNKTSKHDTQYLNEDATYMVTFMVCNVSRKKLFHKMYIYQMLWLFINPKLFFGRSSLDTVKSFKLFIRIDIKQFVLLHSGTFRGYFAVDLNSYLQNKNINMLIIKTFNVSKRLYEKILLNG